MRRPRCRAMWRAWWRVPLMTLPASRSACDPCWIGGARAAGAAGVVIVRNVGLSAEVCERGAAMLPGARRGGRAGELLRARLGRRHGRTRRGRCRGTHHGIHASRCHAHPNRAGLGAPACMPASPGARSGPARCSRCCRSSWRPRNGRRQWPLWPAASPSLCWAAVSWWSGAGGPRRRRELSRHGRCALAGDGGRRGALDLGRRLRSASPLATGAAAGAGGADRRGRPQRLAADRARALAEAGVAARIEFLLARAEALPLPDASWATAGILHHRAGGV